MTQKITKKDIIEEVFYGEDPWKSDAVKTLMGRANEIVGLGATKKQALNIISGVCGTIREEYGG